MMNSASTTARLTIAIPTYNRNEILLGNLPPLLEQLAQEPFASACHLVIYDNASPIPIEETLAPLREQWPSVRFEVKRNRVNIGANANILRCFEECDTPYLWAVGDDDTPCGDALATIFSAIEAHPDCVFFSFSDEKLMRSHSVQTRGADEFIGAADSLWLLLSISSSLFRADVLNSSLRVGYRFEYSHAPHLVTLLAFLTGEGKRGQCRLVQEQVVHWNAPAEGQQWPLLPFALGISTLLELPLSMRARRQLAALIVEAINVEILVLQLLLMAVRSRNAPSSLFLFDQMCARLFYFDKNRKRRLKRRFYRLMLRVPRLSYNALSRFKGRSHGHQLQDLFERI